MKKYKYLLWDLDGTITNSLPGVASALKVLFDHYKIDVPEERYRYYVGPPLRTSFAQHFHTPELMEEALKLFRNEYTARVIGGSELFDGISDALVTLKSRGYIMFMATSKRETAAIEVAKSYGIYDNFERVFGADDTIGIIEKEHVLSNIFINYPEINKNDCVMIGDTMYDVRGAKYIGIDYFAALYGFGDDNELMNSAPVGYVKSPLEYIEIFK